MFFSQTQDMSQLKHLDKFLDKSLDRLRIDRDGVGIKRFTRAFYEIRYNANATSYIPNFDAMSLDGKIDIISILSDTSVEELLTRSAEFIESEFSRLISREVSDLEKDVIEAFS